MFLIECFGTTSLSSIMVYFIFKEIQKNEDFFFLIPCFSISLFCFNYEKKHALSNEISITGNLKEVAT